MVFYRSLEVRLERIRDFPCVAALHRGTSAWLEFLTGGQNAPNFADPLEAASLSVQQN